MTPFYKAITPPEERDRLAREYAAQFAADPTYFEKTFGITSLEKLLATVSKATDDPVWRNDTYQVSVRNDVAAPGWPRMIHLSIKRIDKQPVRDWRDMQEIKNQIVGPEHEAVEIYPAESRKVDCANQYHLWVLADGEIRFPFGFQSRAVDDREMANSKQRPLHHPMSAVELPQAQLSPRVTIRPGDRIRARGGPTYHGARIGAAGIYLVRRLYRIGQRLFVEGDRLPGGGTYDLFIAGRPFRSPLVPTIVNKPYRVSKVRPGQ